MNQLLPTLGRSSAIARRAPPPQQLLKLLEELRYADQARDLDKFFGRVTEAPAREIELPLSQMEEFAQADPGLFANPRVQQMMQEAEYNKAVTPPEEVQEPLADMLRRLERMRTLDRINLPRRPQEVQDLAAVAQRSIDDARAARMAEPAMEADSLRNSLLGTGLATGGGLGGYALLRDLGTVLEGDDGLLEMGSEFDLPGQEMSPAELEFPEEPLMDIGSVDDLLADMPSTEVGLPDEDPMIDSFPPEAMPDGVGPEAEMIEEDTVLGEGMMRRPDGQVRPMIPGLSDMQQRQMDTLVQQGIDPMRALRLVRGQEAMSMEMLRSMRGQ